MSLICQSCKSENVKSYLRNSGLRTDYYCPDCKSKKAPLIVIGEAAEYSESRRSIRQQALDVRRIENAENRKEDRLRNSIREYSRSIYEALKEREGKFVKRKLIRSVIKSGSEVGLVFCTDQHLNEMVELPNNQYDFGIAGQRLRKLANEAVLTLKGRGIKRLVVALGGDLLNSDRRDDELLTQATNRAKATIASVDLVSMFIDDLSDSFESIKVVSVLGNEGRADKEMTWSDAGLSNNYDFTIVAMVKRVLRKNKRVVFGSIDTVEHFEEINGSTVLFSHDIQKATNTQKDTQSTIGRYSITRNINLRMIFGGHMHATKIGDIAVRSGSLVGSNSYNENALNLAGRASQIIAVFGKGGTVNVTSVDLQNVDGVIGYDIDKTLIEYNIKSAKKIAE